MEVKYSDLKRKKVVNILDGKVLGYVQDMVFCYPEAKIVRFICGDKNFFCREEYIVDICNVNKIGDDAVLVCLKDSRCHSDNSCKDRES